jgi:hypothetical protein
MKYFITLFLAMIGSAPISPVMEDSIRMFYIESNYETSYQKYIYSLSKESFLIIQAIRTMNLFQRLVNILNRTIL